MSKVCLGDVAFERHETCSQINNEYPIVGLEHIIPEEINLTKWDKDTENTFSKFFKKGDILFGRRRAYLKKAALAPFDGICSGDITVITPISDKIVPELLPFIIQNDAFFDFAVANSAGSLSPRVKWQHISKYEFELPPMEEQKKLAKILWAAERTRQAYKNLLQKCDDLVKVKFEEMFSKVKIFKKLTEISSPKQWKTIPTKDLLSSGYPVYGANGIIGYNSEYNHENPTILIGCRGTCGFINVSQSKSYINGNAMCLDNLDKNINLKYLEYFLRFFNFEEIITGSTIPQITIEGLQSVNVPIPTEEEQLLFKKIANKIEITKKNLESLITKINQTSASLIQQNFTQGE